jgi:CBS domain containing-hemolysin-like protein
VILLQALAILVCLAGSAFYSGIETGIISIHRMRLEHRIRKGSLGAALLRPFLENSDRLLGTTLVGTNICVVIVSVIAASLAVRWMGEWGNALSTVVVSLVMLVLCEFLPKAWFHAKPLERSRRYVGVLKLSELVFRPIALAVVWLTRGLVPGPSRSFSAPAPFVTREDLKMLAKEGEEGGELSYRERVMIHRVFELSHKRARQIMTPRESMLFVEQTTTLREFFDQIRDSGFTRVPVYDPATDTFTGVINVFFVLSIPESQHDRAVAEFARPPLFIGANMPVDDILPRLRRFRQPMALVRDGEGKVLGLVTTEDILEEIVGNL